MTKKREPLGFTEQGFRDLRPGDAIRCALRSGGHRPGRFLGTVDEYGERPRMNAKDLRPAPKPVSIVVGRRVIATRLLYLTPGGQTIRTTPVVHTRWN